MAGEDQIELGLKSLTDEERRPSDTMAENRARLSDAMREAGRDHEADLLADHRQHVVVHQGKIKRGRFDPREAVSRWDDVWDHLDDWSDGTFARNDYTPDVYDSVGWHNMAFRPQDFEEPPELLPQDHVRLLRSGDSSDPLSYYDVHIAHLPAELASQVADELNSGDYGFNTDDSEENNEQYEEYERLLQHLKESPIEVPDE